MHSPEKGGFPSKTKYFVARLNLTIVTLNRFLINNKYVKQLLTLMKQLWKISI